MTKLKVIAVFSLALITLSVLFVAGCSDKNSTEACLHRTSLDLDKGNYDAVLASSCANSMQIGAAWFGKAGYDITNILNRFIDSSSSTQTKTDLNIYMTSLTGDVSDNTLSCMDNARTAYSSVTAETEGYAAYQDAQFYISLVDAVKSLSVIKIAVPNTVNPDGSLNLTCDVNSNGVPDDADATACALIAANNISMGTALTCNNATYTRSSPIDISLTDSLSQPVSGTFSGLTIAISGSGSSCGGNTYNRLLYKDTSNLYWVATTTTSTCTGSDAQTYYCPVSGQNLDFVTTINTSIDNSLDSLATAITGTNGADVQQSIQDIKAQACTTSCGTVCPGLTCPTTCTSPYDMTFCSSESIANYIETNFK